MRRATLALAIALLVASPGRAATIHVPGDQPTIQAGIDAAAPGDTVLVAPGTYSEQDITLASGVFILGNALDPASIVVQGDGTGSLFTADDLDEPTELGFLTLTGGDSFHGGGIDLEGSDATLHDLIFDANRACRGGGLAVRAPATVSIRDCLFRNNVSECSDGGGAYFYGFNSGVSATLSGCTFLGNSAQGDGHFHSGGAVLANRTALNVDQCKFVDNHVFGRGGALVAAVSSPTVVTRSVFTGNSAAWEGGAAWFYSNPLVSVSDCLIDSNTAPFGGGLAIESTPASFVACTFRDNIATTSGGGLHIRSSAPEVEYCLFTGNQALRGGGLLYETQILGRIRHCTFWGNSAETGGAICTELIGILPEHTIVAYNTGGGAASGIVGFSCSTLYGNVGGDWTGFFGDDRATTFGNFSADPLFCDADDGNFHIRSDSPCAPPGVTNCGLVGALPVGCGPVAIEEESWARIKSKYR